MEMLIGINLVIQEMNDRKRPESGQLIRKRRTTSTMEKMDRGELKKRELQKFLNDHGIIKVAIGYMNDVGKFCKFVADILIPQEYLLKLYFPTKHTRRPKEKLFDEQVVDTFNIAAKYLVACIIKEEKKFLSRGVLLINARMYDKSKRNRNVKQYRQ
uniref:RNA-directed DNA polymerase-like protein n=1 Tax=Strongyloides venezuelensis TaxID=75913 RepID=A0A0K0FCI8_STRVS